MVCRSEHAEVEGCRAQASDRQYLRFLEHAQESRLRGRGKIADLVEEPVFDRLREEVIRDRAELFRQLALAFFGADRRGSKVSRGLLEAFWLWARPAGTKALLDGITAFSGTDFSRDLATVDLPTLVVRADDDRIVPISVSALRAVRMLKNPTLSIYPGAAHGLPMTHASQLNQDVLDFIGR